MSGTVGEKIREARLARGMSQDTLAQRVGYKSRGSINKIELGKTDVSHAKLAAIAEALRVPPTWLLGFDEKPDFVIENGELFALIGKATPEEIQKTVHYLRMLIYTRNMKDGDL